MHENGSKPSTNGNKPRKLTIKQQAFVEYYLQSWNASDAARRAAYKSPAMSGHENLQKPYVQAHIKARMNEISMDADEALMRLSRSARWDPGRYMIVSPSTGDVSVDVQAIIDEGWSFMIKGVRDTVHGQIVDFHDAQAAAKHIDQRDKELRIRMAANVTVGMPDWMFPDVDEISDEEADRLYNEMYGDDDDKES